MGERKVLFADGASTPLSATGGSPFVHTSSLRSTNPVVQKALDASSTLLAAIKAQLPPKLANEVVEQYRRLPEALGRQYVEMILTLNKSVSASGRSVKDGDTEEWFNERMQDILTGIQQLMEREERQKKLDAELVRLETLADSIGGKCGASESEIGLIRKDLQTLKQQVVDGKEEVDKSKNYVLSEVEKIRERAHQESAEKIGEYLRLHSASIGELEEKVKGLCALATVGVFSAHYDEKRKSELKSMRVKSALFYGALIGFAILGYLTIQAAVSAVDPGQAELLGARAYWIALPKVAAGYLPFYLPLIWFACHVNRLMNQARRLMEEYAHKVVVAQTYSGVSAQIESLAKQGIASAKDLHAELLRSTITVLCSNPNTAIDKVKSVTPLSEVVDGASRLIEASGRAKGS